MDVEVDLFEVRAVTAEVVEAMERLVPQLSASAAPPAVGDIEQLVRSDATTLLLARLDGAIVGMLTPPLSETSISISLASRSPERNRRRNFSRVSCPALSPTRAVTTRSSAATSARAETALRRRWRVMWIAISTRSRTICSTSRPT